jgi:phosphoglycolate phosphatase-like HAD superfamily hydrolase
VSDGRRDRAGIHRLVLFDIDGTLIHTGGAGSRAMTRAFVEACGIENGLDGIPVPGRTDTLIVADACAMWGVDGGDAFLAAFQQTYYRCLAEELSRLPQDAAGVLPGVKLLLDTLATDEAFTVGLLTGNYAATAQLKLARFGLWGYFPFGAFGGDAAQREALVAVAVQRARAAGMREVNASDVVVVGDTPLDVACAHANAARVLAVATGSFAAADLCAAGADLVVNDLSDTRAIVRWLRT